MKYRVYVKEIWVQPYLVEAQSKAHAKHLVETARQHPIPGVYKEGMQPQPWGMIGAEKWEVEEVG